MECEQSLPVCVHSGVTCKVRLEGLNMGSPVSHSPPPFSLFLSLSHHDISLKALHAFPVAEAQHRNRKTRAEPETGAKRTEKGQSYIFSLST